MAFLDDEDGLDVVRREITHLDRRWRFEVIRTTGCPPEARLIRSSASGVMWTVQDIGRRHSALLGAARLIDYHLAHLTARVLEGEPHGTHADGRRSG